MTASAYTTKGSVVRKLLRDRWLYLMLIPGVCYFLAFKYLPMWGVLISFMDFSPFLGFMGSKWVGWKHFDRLFSDPNFWRLLRNTLFVSFYNLIFFFPLPIVLALLLNELRSVRYKRVVQSIIYMPHFMSWVVIYSLSVILFNTDTGILAKGMETLWGKRIDVLASSRWFRTLVIGQSMWKEAGWGTIIFMAALTAIDPQLYEAAHIDGAGRWRQTWHITLPTIRSTIVVLLVLRMGKMLDTGVEQIYLLLNAMNRPVGNVFDTFVYNSGIKQGQFSYSTAVGLFKSVVGLVLVLLSNAISRKMGEEGLF